MWAIKTAPPVVPNNTLPTFVGANSIFLSLIPYVVAHGVQIENIQTALIIATSLSGAIVLLGLILYFLAARRIPLYLLDSAMLVTLVVQLGVSYAKELDIARNFVFITNSALAGLSMVSMMVGYPFMLQHVREAIPRPAWRHPSTYQVAYITTSVFAAACTISCMLYLVPVAEDVWMRRSNALTIVFRVVVPCVVYVAALIVARLAPLSISHHLEGSQGFDGIYPDSAAAWAQRVGMVHHNPLAV